MPRLNLLARGRDCARRLAACAVADWRLTATLFALRISLPLAKRVMSVSKLAAALWSAPDGPDVDPTRAETIARIRFAMKSGGRLLVSSNCLERSLAMYHVLSRAGATPALVLGTRRDGAALAGHAWIELDGNPFAEPDAGDYVRVITFGVQGSRFPADSRVPAVQYLSQ